MEIVFDIESNGLLDVLDTIHCISHNVIETDDIVSSNHQPNYIPIERTLETLENASALIGHNIQEFDIPAIQKVYPQWKPKGIIYDTLIMSRLQHVHDRMKHSLESWGDTVGIAKGDFGKLTDWAEWSEAMQLYCDQDVRVNIAVWHYLRAENFSEESIRLEHDFARVCQIQMNNGIHFDVDKAQILADKIISEERTLREELTAGIPPFVKETPFTPKVNRPDLGYIKGVPTIKRTVTPFNPGSRQQVITLLKERYNWKPTEFTDKGNPKVSGDVLRELPFGDMDKLAHYYDVKKLMGQLATGKNAWLKVHKNGKIYGYINHNGAVTSRCTHSGPNLAQVPSVDGFMGAECRELFRVPEGETMVGCDASGIELRNLSHYMYPYDGGKYVETILDGDIHTSNQEAAGLPTRHTAKRFIYAHNYGAGDAKLGALIVPTAPLHIQKMRGQQARAMFMARTPAMSMLIEQLRHIAKTRGYLLGLDKRRLYVHSDHVALNVLLQGAGAVIMKKWYVEVYRWVEDNGHTDYIKPLLHIHDEGQFRVTRRDLVEPFKEVCERTFEEVGQHFNYNCPLAGEAKEGQTWKDTH